jgi:VanZ family protein
VAWAAAVFILSSIPGDDIPDVKLKFGDKYAHFLVYMAGGWLLMRAAWPTGRGAAWLPRAAAAAGIGILYGATDEWHQIFVRNRSCTLSDWIIDCVAVIAGIVVWRLQVGKNWSRR